jgi:triosephosphate isomerase
MKTKYIVGNWKMNPGKLEDAKKILRGIERKVPKSKKVTAIICPPFVYIQPLKKVRKKFLVGAQNVFSETSWRIHWGSVSRYAPRPSRLAHYCRSLRAKKTWRN